MISLGSSEELETLLCNVLYLHRCSFIPDFSLWIIYTSSIMDSCLVFCFGQSSWPAMSVTNPYFLVSHPLINFQGNKLASGVLFAVLLNFKHIYMYLAVRNAPPSIHHSLNILQPAYFIYLLRSFCMSPSGQILPVRFLALANAVIAVFVISLGPFILMGQLSQVGKRLFPFTRGLNHAYWAPNVWSLVTALDRVLLQCQIYSSWLRAFTDSGIIDVKRLGVMPMSTPGVASTSRGLVGDTVFAVLPNIQPIHTFIVTISFQLVRLPSLNLLWRYLTSFQIFLGKLWFTPTYKSFVTALTLCGYASFMFGWHVHEKAILLVLVPLRYDCSFRIIYCKYSRCFCVQLDCDGQPPTFQDVHYCKCSRDILTLSSVIHTGW